MSEQHEVERDIDHLRNYDYAKYLNEIKEIYLRQLNLLKSVSGRIREQYKPVLLETDVQLWLLLNRERETVFRIEDWEIYRRVAGVFERHSNPEGYERGGGIVK